MTATLNPTLLNNLQRMIGIRITPPMWIWGSRNRMQRRTVKISIKISSTYMRIIRPILIETLSNNLHKTSSFTPTLLKVQKVLETKSTLYSTPIPQSKGIQSLLLETKILRLNLRVRSNSLLTRPTMHKT